MEDLTFTQMQAYLVAKYEENATSSDLFMKLVEEVGEVAEALNCLEGRKKDSGDASLEKELADVIHYAVAIASINQIDLTHVILEKDQDAAAKYNHSLNLVEFLSKEDRG
ncbi:nucleotide pyrophosphohydrolase [Alkalihalobacillus sp. LMS6]|uniref:MazG nucleotide pyrophosphohydrolase domain-containing protein n=1 Tax=Alkalihalobacillus sp. LMS6 TaxID=2924034 RepID=UPI0020D1997B|nr:MazG nucleotide pyrophosphohydrolase domain-containing protein [Alkalihalobacillus sp. LMS6]UTR07146.1 nucleotide pyrophosphohydrolase [Alkalihalobacillus sp. LMS6]